MVSLFTISSMMHPQRTSQVIQRTDLFGSNSDVFFSCTRADVEVMSSEEHCSDYSHPELLCKCYGYIATVCTQHD